MGHISSTPAGNWRANWRDPSGTQKAKTFKTKKEARAYLAEVETTRNRGAYIDPHAGRVRFGVIAGRWADGRPVGARTVERNRSVLRTHILPKWESWPIGEIDHMSAQAWANDLAKRLAAATVQKVFGTFALVMRFAVRSRVIAVDPTEGVKLPAVRDRDHDLITITQEVFVERLLTALPPEHRALVSSAAGAGLRWGEAAGAPWDAFDLSADVVDVRQVAEETSGAVHLRPYPKTRAGRRRVPLAPFMVAELRAHLGRLQREPDGRALAFGTSTGTALRRSNFRRQVWRPALVRAGLLGSVTERGQDRWRATWRDAEGIEWSHEVGTERDAVALVAQRAAGGLKFHHLRHSYATWLISRGVPVNVVQTVMGHERPVTTLRIYTHVQQDYGDAVRAAFEAGTDDPLTSSDDSAAGESEAGESDAA
jgi:integrase